MSQPNHAVQPTPLARPEPGRDVPAKLLRPCVATQVPAGLQTPRAFELVPIQVGSTQFAW